MKILTVEDDDINAMIMDKVLEQLSFEYEHKIARDGDMALEISKSDNFDLVLMDINLGNGKMDGTEVMKILKAKDDYSSVPIFAVTCYSLESDKKRFLSEGFDNYFSKPIDTTKLIETIENLKVNNN